MTLKTKTSQPSECKKQFINFDENIIDEELISEPIHEPLLLDSPVKIELWKSSKWVFVENSFNKDKSIGL